MATDTSAGSTVTSGDGGNGDQRQKRWQMSDRRLAKVFIAPSMLTMAIVVLFPVIYATILRLYLHSGREQIGFGGLQNFTTALFAQRRVISGVMSCCVQ